MLFLYEIKKLFKNKLFVSILIILLAVNALSVYSVCRDYLTDDTYKLETNLTDKFEGEITKEKVDLITAEYARLAAIIDSNSYSTEYDSSTYTGYQMMDYNVFSQLYGEISRIYNFSNNTESKVNELKQAMKLFDENKNQRQYVKYEKTVNAISKRSINEIHNYKGVTEYHNYDMSFLLIAIISVLIAVLLFSTDKEMVDTIYTGSHSKKRIFSAKELTLLFAVVFVVALFKAVDFGMFKALIGLRGISSPLYYLEGYDFTSFNCSILCFTFLNFISITVKMFVVSNVCGFIAMIIRKSNYSMILSVAILGVFIAVAKLNINQDFIYPSYFGFVETGYAKIIVWFVVFVITALILHLTHKRIIKNGNIKI